MLPLSNLESAIRNKMKKKTVLTQAFVVPSEEKRQKYETYVKETLC